MTVPRQKNSTALRKIKNWLNRVQTRFGSVPREHLFVNGHELSIRHRQTRANIDSILQCLVRKQYEIPEIRGALAGSVDRHYSAVLDKKKTPLIIDAGANIAASALWFAARFPKSHILAIEPAPDNFECLRKNVREFDVEAGQVGLDARGGHATQTDPGYGPWSYRTKPASDG